MRKAIEEISPKDFMMSSEKDTLEYDVFLSHSHADADDVEELAKHLEDIPKLKVWFDKLI